MIREKSEAEIKIEETAASLGLTVTSEFVPFSQSRAAKPSPKLSDLSLNWKVTLSVKGRDFLTTDYGAGCGHCPSYKQGKMTIDDGAAVLKECETGTQSAIVSGGRAMSLRGKPIKPKSADVICSLVLDSDVIDCGSFEEWAGDLGYDVDSRKAEATYRSCLEIALKLRNAIGEAGLQQLREACQDY